MPSTRSTRSASRAKALAEVSSESTPKSTCSPISSRRKEDNTKAKATGVREAVTKSKLPVRRSTRKATAGVDKEVGRTAAKTTIKSFKSPIKKTKIENTPKNTAVTAWVQQIVDAVGSAGNTPNQAGKVVNSWTPVLDKRKAATKNVLSFPERLDWRFRSYGMPVTSTPTAAETTSTATKTDVENCFGFNEPEEDENYSALISPIIARNTSPNLVNKGKTKTKKADGKRAPQINGPKEPLKISSLANGGGNSITNIVKNDEKKNVKEPSKKKTTRKIYTRQPKNKNPAALHPVTKSKKVPMVKSSAMFDLDEFMSSQQLEIDLSGPVSDEAEKIFVKETNEGDVGFNALLARYGQNNDEEPEFHIDPKNIKKTYQSKKRETGEIVSFLPQKPKRSRRSTIPRRSLGLDKQQPPSDQEEEEDSSESETDPEVKKWEEQQNKEFEDVLHVPLMVANVHTRENN